MTTDLNLPGFVLVRFMSVVDALAVSPIIALAYKCVVLGQSLGFALMG